MPVRRVGQEYEEIGWDEAFDEAASRLKNIRDRHGRDSLAVYLGNPSVHNWGTLLYGPMFLKALAPGNRFSATSVDQLPHHLAAYLMFGHQLLLPVPDIDRTDYLLGDRTYRLRVPPNPPVKRFWAVTAYDPATRGLLASDGAITVGSQTDPVVNADGSVDLYFGQSAPEGFEKNLITTDPDKGFFVVFRFYGPTEGYIEKTCVLNYFEKIDG